MKEEGINRSPTLHMYLCSLNLYICSHGDGDVGRTGLRTDSPESSARFTNTRRSEEAEYARGLCMDFQSSDRYEAHLNLDGNHSTKGLSHCRND